MNNPFPGLRSFQTEEDYLFFGRDAQTWELLSLLREHRFLAVVGASGSGKSSLVRAGLLPGLHRGTMNEAGSSWDVVVMRPGGDPMTNLARGFCESGLYDDTDPDAIPHLVATLNHNRQGLVDAARQSDLEPDVNLLVVVDQFEELFRFSGGNMAAAGAFVRLLLEASKQKKVPIYIVLTMRSDYLGDCAQFPGLAEAVNVGEYLIPRLNRDQKIQAIEGPVKVGGAQVAPRLLQRLLNDLGKDPDQLPVLQHALMRTWSACKADQSSVAQSAKEGGMLVDLPHYESTGGVKEALSRHADEVFDTLPDDRHRQVAAKVFMALTERGSDNRGIRRPTRFDLLCAIVSASESEVMTVLDAFRKQGRTFIMPAEGTPIGPDTVIDISHESLMRVWVRLKTWVEDEAQSARIYLRLAETAQLEAEGNAGLYHDPDLQIALSWRDSQKPSEAWGRRYHHNFEQAVGFLQRSREAAEEMAEAREAARQRELDQTRQLAKARQRSATLFKWFGIGMALVAVVAVVATVMAVNASSKATEKEAQASAAAADALEANQQLKMVMADARHKEGQSWLLKAQALQEQNDRFSAKIMAGRALGYQGVGRELQGEAFQEAYPILLKPGSAAADAAREILDLAHVSLPIHVRSSGSFHDGPIRAVAYMDQGKTLITGGDDFNIRFWDMDSGNEKRRFFTDQAHGFVFDVALNPSETLLIAGTRYALQFWDLATGTLTNVWQPDTNNSSLVSMDLSPDGGRLALWCDDGQTRLLNLTNLTMEAQWPHDKTTSVKFTRDGNHVLCIVQDAIHLFRWDIANGAAQVIPLNGRIRSTAAAIHPDGTQYALFTHTAGGESARLEIVEAGTGNTLESFVNDFGRWGVRGVAYAANGTMLGYVGGTSGSAGLRLWDLNTFDPIPLSVMEDTIQVINLAVQPEDGTIATVDLAGRIRLFDRATRRAHLNRATEKIYANHGLQFSPDGRMFFATGNGITRMIDVATGSIREVLPNEGTVCVSSDGQWILTEMRGIDETLLHRRQSGAYEWFQSLPSLDFVADKAFSADNTVLARSIQQNGIIEFRDTQTWDRIGDFQAHTQQAFRVFFPSDRHTLITAGLEAKDTMLSIRIWTSPPGLLWPPAMTNLVREIPVPMGQGTGKMERLRFSNDGRYAALPQAGSAGQLLMVWDLTTGLSFELQTLAHSVAFGPDNEWLAVGKNNGIIELRNLPGGYIREQLNALANVRDSSQETQINSLAVSPDGSLLIAGDQLQRYTYWNLRPAYQTIPLMENGEAHASGIYDVAVSPDGTGMATVDLSGDVVVWSAVSGQWQPTNRFTLDQELGAVTWSPDGNQLVVGSELGKLYLIDLTTGQVTFEESIYTDQTRSITFTPDGKHLTVASRSGPIKVGNLQTPGDWHESIPLTDPTTPMDMDYSPDGRWLAVCLYGGLMLWDAHEKKASLHRHPDHPRGVQAAEFSPDGRTLYLANKAYGQGVYYRSGVSTFDMATRTFREFKELSFVRNWGEEMPLRPLNMVLSPAGDLLAFSTRDGIVMLLEANSLAILGKSRIRSGSVRGLAFSRDGKTLITAGYNVVHTWSVADLKNPHTDLTDYLTWVQPEGRELEWQMTGLETNLYRLSGMPMHRVDQSPWLFLLTADMAESVRSGRMFDAALNAKNLTAARYFLNQLPPDDPGRKKAAPRLGRRLLEQTLERIRSATGSLIANQQQETALDWLQSLSLFEVYRRLDQNVEILAEDMITDLVQARDLDTTRGDPTLFIAKGARWKYLDDGSDQGSAWRDEAFDDSTWQAGPAVLGYGDTVSTEISFGNNQQEKHLTTYFRHRFVAPIVRSNLALTLNLRVDDGAVVYLNGTEMLRDNLPNTNEITHLTEALRSIGNVNETNYEAFFLESRLLKPGTNVLAVEVHQSSPTSTDLQLDLNLIQEVLWAQYLGMLDESTRLEALERLMTLLPTELKGDWETRFRFAWTRDTQHQPAPDDIESWIMRARVQHFLYHTAQAQHARDTSIARLNELKPPGYRKEVAGQKLIR